MFLKLEGVKWLAYIYTVVRYCPHRNNQWLRLWLVCLEISGDRTEMKTCRTWCFHFAISAATKSHDERYRVLVNIQFILLIFYFKKLPESTIDSVNDQTLLKIKFVN